MSTVTIRVLHCGRVCVSPYLPFGGEHCGLLRAAGLTTRPRDRLWLPVSAYLIEHPHGRILVDTGWHRAMSPDGVYDVRAQLRHLSPPLYAVNPGVVARGEAVDEQLAALGLRPEDLDYVLLTHLDCDHVSGVQLVRAARHILVAAEELPFAARHPVRYRASMWAGVRLEPFAFQTTGLGPAGRSYDLFGDGSVQLVSIPGHSAGLFAVQVQNAAGAFVLLCSDGAYAARSWQEMIRPGISADPTQQLRSLRWIRERSCDPLCVGVLANHDPAVVPHTVVL